MLHSCRALQLAKTIQASVRSAYGFLHSEKCGLLGPCNCVCEARCEERCIVSCLFLASFSKPHEKSGVYVAQSKHCLEGWQKYHAGSRNNANSLILYSLALFPVLHAYTLKHFCEMHNKLRRFAMSFMENEITPIATLLLRKC